LALPEGQSPGIAIRTKPLAGERFEVQVGDASDWLIDRPLPPQAPQWSIDLGPYRRNSQVGALAREALGPLLITDQEARTRIRSRM
jgi:hypothetical protein